MHSPQPDLTTLEYWKPAVLRTIVQDIQYIRRFSPSRRYHLGGHEHGLVRFLVNLNYGKFNLQSWSQI